MLPSPVRPADLSLLQAEALGAAATTQKPAPALGNCFNSGVCEWLCAHRAGLQWALGLETLALLGLLAFYARLNRALGRQQQGLDEDEVRRQLCCCVVA